MLKDIKKILNDKEFRDMFLHGFARGVLDAAAVTIIVGVGFLLVYAIVSLTF